LELRINLVQIKGIRIELVTCPFHPPVVIGVLRIVDRCQKTRVSPETTAILGGAGTFACQTERIALALVQRQPLFDEQLMFPAIPKIVLIEALPLWVSISN